MQLGDLPVVKINDGVHRVTTALGNIFDIATADRMLAHLLARDAGDHEFNSNLARPFEWFASFHRQLRMPSYVGFRRDGFGWCVDVSVLAKARTALGPYVAFDNKGNYHEQTCCVNCSHVLKSDITITPVTNGSTMTIDEIIEKLSAPFPVEQIEWRVGATNEKSNGGVATKGIALAYLTSRMVMDRLDDVVGAFNWQIKHEMGDGGKVVAHIGIRNAPPSMPLGGKIEDYFSDWVWKSDGAGATDVEGDKGSFSDSCKRAGVQWGIGRYLYAIENTWVAVVPAGRSYRIADHELERLYKTLPNNTGGVTVNEPSGLSKKPAKFWGQPSLNILGTLPKALLDAHGDPAWTDPDTIHKASELIRAAIEKAPSRLALTKLQVDNLRWIGERLPPEDRTAIMESFQIRAAQHDQQEKK